MQNKESIQYDCSRGCMVTHDASGETCCSYRPGCCKLGDYNWLKDAQDGSYKGVFEVRFKNTRKGFYINDSPQNVRLGDMVVVEATTGLDLGIVTLEGPIVGRQMKAKGIDPENTEFKKIYRKARQSDIERWQEAIAREHETMIKARSIAAEMGLEMKIGDVEFQGDGSKAIFYYIADGRVDFRQLIKVFAEEFRIRIEMKQIGARQEAGLIGGLGICGRELCCANYISSFQSISTSAARCQDLSLNPQKLAGQCGKLKCCLNYEVATYMDAQSRIPKVSGPLEFEDGLAYLRKTDILRELMYFSYDKSSDANLYPLEAAEVMEIIKMNRNGLKPESLRSEPAPAAPEFVTAVGDDSITRFDTPKRRKSRSRKGGNGSGPRQGQGERRPRPKGNKKEAAK
ncbi:MAG: regulatory iron-sulfur-containing complex subunit RicT [Candidatus Cryptobacteroides sp.]|nr:regulatory iron-sulfur-containing complex subunit RicT [Rikenellaceae bacterium]MDY5747211.1 regulatory iron-sulfur-containing complex subunit RicT [Candidatus Cryptobacteroides sp.]